MSADRGTIHRQSEERIRNLTSKAPVRPCRRSMLKRSPKPTQKLGEGFEFKEESVQQVTQKTFCIIAITSIIKFTLNAD